MKWFASLVLVAAVVLAGCGKRPGQKQHEQRPSPTGDSKPTPTADIFAHPGTWVRMPTENAPSGRSGHQAFWDSGRLIVYGGVDADNKTLLDGGIFDTRTNRWTGIPARPDSERTYESVAWAGSRLVVWGGQSGPTILNTGFIFDPDSGTWAATNLESAPSAREFTQVFPYQGKVIVWGGLPGCNIVDGAVLDPVANTWMKMAKAPAAIVAGCDNASWTGTKLVVWGSYPQGENTPFSGSAVYDAATNSWEDVQAPGAPGPRYDPLVLASNDFLFVWGGDLSEGQTIKQLHNGGIYSFASRKWTPVSKEKLANLAVPAALLSPSRVFIWGGTDGLENPQGGSASVPASGAILDMTSGTWTSVPRSPRSKQGNGGSPNLAPNGRVFVAQDACDSVYEIFDSASGVWASASTSGAPPPRGRASDIWTGTAFITWGGSTCGAQDKPSSYDGYTYVPATLVVPSAAAAKVEASPRPGSR